MFCSLELMPEAFPASEPADGLSKIETLAPF